MHHLETEPAALGQVVAHDVVARLGHDRDLADLVEGVDAEAEPGDAVLVGELLHEVDVGVELDAGLLGREERRARELDLSTGLERHARLVVLERDRAAAFGDTLEARVVGDLLEQCADAVGAFVGDAIAGVGVHADLLVLGAHAPERLRLLGGPEVVEQVARGLDGPVLGVHRGAPSERALARPPIV
ncbi:MAG: hypothetical protein R3E53_12305 [Myxococcota bacterium]